MVAAMSDGIQIVMTVSLTPDEYDCLRGLVENILSDVHWGRNGQAVPSMERKLAEKFDKLFKETS